MLGVGSLSDYAIASYSRDGTITTITVANGSLTLVGGSIVASSTLPVIHGVLHLTGADIPFYRVIVENGELHLAGQSIVSATTIPVANGNLTLSGAAADFMATMALVKGSLILTGHDIASYPSLPVLAGSLTLTRYPASFMTTLELENGQLTLTGHDFFVGRVIVDTGYLHLTGYELPLFPTIRIEPNFLRLRPGDDIGLTPIGGSSGGPRRPKNYRTGFEPVIRKTVPATKPVQRKPELPPFQPHAQRIVPTLPEPGPQVDLDFGVLGNDIAMAQAEYIDQQDADDMMLTMQDIDDIGAILELID